MKRALLLFALTGALPALAAPDTAGGASDGSERPVVTLAFSSALFGNVNKNDVDAALQVYARAVADNGGFALARSPRVLVGPTALAEALRHQEVDVISLTTEEFLAMEERNLVVGPLLAARVNRVFTEEYVLLAQHDSGIRKVEDLKGRSLVVSTELRASLARIWLDVICLEQGLGAASGTLGRLTSAERLTLVVLPVFFGQVDACVVTRSGFEVMGELNPQVKKQLRVVAESKPMVPTFTAFRRGLSEAHRQRIIGTTIASSHQPAFAQLKSLFKTDQLGQQPLSALDSARELLATHRRLLAMSSGTSAVPSAHPATNGERLRP